MNDRELLELAAKAARLSLETSYDINGEYWPWCHEYKANWCPLTDNGDALKLAVKLELVIAHLTGRAIAARFDCLAQIEKKDNDPYGATRRAIVSAAAEIGKAMESA